MGHPREVVSEGNVYWSLEMYRRRDITSLSLIKEKEESLTKETGFKF